MTSLLDYDTTGVLKLKELADQHDLGLNMWVIGMEEALAVSQHVDKVILTDIIGTWRLSFPTDRYVNNFCYEPCIYDESKAKCCPYTSNIQQTLRTLSFDKNMNISNSYHLLEKKFASVGAYNLLIEVLGDQDVVLTSETYTINVTVDGSQTFCTPNCTGKTCGDDGCGGNCGSCDKDEICNNTEGGYFCTSGFQQTFADFNKDYNVSLADYGLFVDSFLDYRSDVNTFNSIYDLDGSGGMNLNDYSLYVEDHLSFLQPP